MREIKFRGKSIKSGKWVHGSLVYKIISNKKIPLIGNFFNGEFKGEEVYPKSIGQYTGVDTSDGCPVYEGDIIEWQEGKIYNFSYGTGVRKWDIEEAKKQAYTQRRVIEFHDGKFWFYPHIPLRVINNENYIYAIKSYCSETSYITFNFKIIGNIHDNSDLLEGY